MKTARVSHLGHVLLASLISAGLGFLYHAEISPWIQSLLGRYAGGRSLESATATALAYTTIFVTGLVVLLFAGHHLFIRVSLKAQRMEKANGIAPVLARFILVAVVFGGALFLALGRSTPLPSLNDLVTAAQNKKDITPETGYNNKDRQKLDKLIHEGAKHD